jgi:hypothetical protein
VQCPPSLATEPKQAPPARTVHDITRPDLDAASTLCDSLGIERLDPRATGEANDQQPVVNRLLNLGISFPISFGIALLPRYSRAIELLLFVLRPGFETSGWAYSGGQL